MVESQTPATTPPKPKTSARRSPTGAEYGAKGRKTAAI